MSAPDEQKFSNLVNALNTVLSRQDRLEARIAQLEQMLSGSTVRSVEPEPSPQLVVEPIAEAIELPPPQPPILASVRQNPALETKVGLTVVNRIGVLTLVLGVAFFFKWAVDNNYIGASGRVILGLLAGFGTLALADFLWRKGQQTFAQGITGTGVAIIYLAFYAAFDFYHLIPQSVAFGLLLATTAMAATLALRYNAIAIAALGFFGAYVIPLLLSTGEDHPWFLLTYLLLINFAVASLVAKRGWQLLELLSFVASVLIFGTWLITHDGRTEDRLPATVGVLALLAQCSLSSWRILFLIGELLTALSISEIWPHQPNTFAALSILVAAGGLAFAHFRAYPTIVATVFSAFWISVWAISPQTASNAMPVATAGFLLFTTWTWWRGALRNESPAVGSMSVFALNGVAYYGIAYSVLRHDYHHWLGLLAVGVAASYLAFGIFLYRRSAEQKPDLRFVLLALGISVAFLTLAIPIQLSGFTVTIAWSIQAAALTWIGLRLNSTRAIMAALVVFGLALVRLAIVDSGMYGNAESYSLLLNSRFYVFAVLATAFLLAAYWASKLDRKLALIHFVAGHLVLLAGLCMEVIGWAQRSARPENKWSIETIGITILFAIYAVILVSIGVTTSSAVNRLAGLALTAVVILKLYLYDVWQLGRVYQIIAFVILGILLLSTSFLYSRFKGLVDEWWRDLPKQEKDESSTL